MAESSSGRQKGGLNAGHGEHRFQLSRFMPSGKVSFFIEHFWIVEWNLGQRTHQQEILAYPSVHLSFERKQTKIFGVVTGKFSRTISGEGKVLGIKFRPGGFYPFLKSPVSSFTDGTIPLDTISDVNTSELEDYILKPSDKEKMVERAIEFIKHDLPEPDERVTFINKLIKQIIDDPKLILVDQLVEKIPMSKRSIQQLFSKYVGVSPKWVIKRYRLHEVAGKLAENNDADWAELAVDLGYYDQANFINDFRTIVGKTPAKYAQDLHG